MSDTKENKTKVRFSRRFFKDYPYAGCGLTTLGKKIKNFLDFLLALSGALFVVGCFTIPALGLIAIILGFSIALPWFFFELGKSNWED